MRAAAAEAPHSLRGRLGAIRPTLARHAALALLIGILLWALTLAVDTFTDYELAAVGYIAIGAAGLTLLTGLNGQLSLGHGALMAIGAYATALLLKRAPDLNPALTLPIALLAAAAAAAIIGTAAARLRGPYLAGATLALAVALPGVAIRFSDVFGGDAGTPVPALAPPAALTSTAPEQWLAWLTLVAGLLVFVLLSNLVRTRFGRDLRAIRDDEIAAKLYGIPVARTRVLAFVISGACAGLAGALLAYWSNLAAPGGFPLTLSLSLLAAIVIGGLGTLPGALWGAFIVVFVPQWIGSLNDSLHLPGALRDQLPLALYGAVFVAAMLAFPHGIQGLLARVWALRSRRRLALAEASET